MKIKSIIKSALFAAGFSALALMGGAQAQILVNGQFSKNDLTPSNILDGTGSGATIAPLAYTGTTWNELGTAGNVPTALLNSTGGSSGITYTFTGTTFSLQDHSLSPLELLKSYGYRGSGTSTLTFSGLTNGDTYDIVLAADGSNLDSTVSIPGYGSQSTTNADDETSSFILDGNYVEFLNVAPTSGSITVSVTGGPGNGGTYYAVDGFQIQDVTAPEPSTMALLGLGGLAFLAIRRRRSLV